MQGSAPETNGSTMRSEVIDSGPEGPGAGTGSAAPEERLDRPLPEAVRQRVVEAAADLIGSLPLDEVPLPLRRFARFEPRKRAKLAAHHLAAQLEKDADFRERACKPMRESEPDLVAALEAGTVPAAADPVHVAALAYLIRPGGWTTHVANAYAELERSASVAEEEAVAREVAGLRAQLAEARSNRSAELDKARSEARELRTEVAELRRRLHEMKTRAKAAEERAETLAAEAEQERAASAAATGAAEKELRKLRGRLAQAESAAEAAKRATREGRNVEDVRLRMLLDALVDAAQGVKRELALPSIVTRPADLVGGIEPANAAHRALPGRALSDNDPQLLEQLLTLPQVHLIVDGYNVTKTGYGDLPLADQRTRLVSGLGGLAAQTGAEITVVFDGAELEAPVAISAPRGVRVRFSQPGQIADELIGQLVRAEPRGRAVVVVSSDREVADAARRAGARPASSTLLLRRLSRG